MYPWPCEEAERIEAADSDAHLLSLFSSPSWDLFVSEGFQGFLQTGAAVG